MNNWCHTHSAFRYIINKRERKRWRFIPPLSLHVAPSWYIAPYPSPFFTYCTSSKRSALAFYSHLTSALQTALVLRQETSRIGLRKAWTSKKYDSFMSSYKCLNKTPHDLSSVLTTPNLSRSCFHQRRVWNERRCPRHGACAGHRSLGRTDGRTDSLFLSCLSAAVSHHLLLLGRVDWGLCVETVCVRPLVSALQTSSTPAFTHPRWQDLDSSWLLAIKATGNMLLLGHIFFPCLPPTLCLSLTHTHSHRYAHSSFPYFQFSAQLLHFMPSSLTFLTPSLHIQSLYKVYP